MEARRKQAHDELTTDCKSGAAVAPGLWEDLHLPAVPFSLPYRTTVAGALYLGIAGVSWEHCSLEEAAPTLMDPNRMPESLHAPRWFRAVWTPLNNRLPFFHPPNARPRHSLLLACGDPADHKLVLFVLATSVLQILCPVRL